MRHARRRRTTTLLLAACMPMLASASGCDYVAAGMYVIQGPPKIERQYELNQTRKTVVFVDDRAGAMPRKTLRRLIGQGAEETLLAEKALLPELVIPSAAAVAAVTQETRNEPMTVVEVGRAVGADVVVYVSVEKFTLSRDGAANQPFAVAYVKIFDAQSNSRLWPEDASGRPVMYSAAASAQLPTTLGEQAKAEEALARRLGVEVARLFFSYERESSAKRQTG